MVRQGLISVHDGVRGWDRLLQIAAGGSTTSSTSSTYDDDYVWTPINPWDHVNLGVTVAYQAVVLLVVLHLWVCRRWPPYITRQTSMVCMNGVAGVVAYCGSLIAYGVFERHEGEFLANCGVEALFDYTGWGVWTSVALVRVYRSWKILVRHTADMWPAWGQVALISAPWLTPALAYSIKPDLAGFSERGNWCDINVPIDTGLYLYGTIPIFGALFLSFQMRRVRKQMNFFPMQVTQLLFLLLTGTVIFPLLEGWLEEHDDIRRTFIMYDNVMSSLILFWPPIAEPFYRYLIGDEEYLKSYTKGFSSLPTPAQMRSTSFRDQMSCADLRREFEKFADSNYARELPDFYQACLDRDEVEDFFKRQAVTSSIIDRFVRIGATQEVNISDKVRSEILSSAITSYNIFENAMKDVLKLMESNFSAEFQSTEAYKNLRKVAEEEAAELEVLKQMGQLPPDHYEESPTAMTNFIRKVGHTVATLSGDGSNASDNGSVTSPRDLEKNSNGKDPPPTEMAGGSAATSVTPDSNTTDAVANTKLKLLPLQPSSPNASSLFSSPAKVLPNVESSSDVKKNET